MKKRVTNLAKKATAFLLAGTMVVTMLPNSTVPSKVDAAEPETTTVFFDASKAEPTFNQASQDRYSRKVYGDNVPEGIIYNLELSSSSDAVIVGDGEYLQVDYEGMANPDDGTTLNKDGNPVSDGSYTVWGTGGEAIYSGGSVTFRMKATNPEDVNNIEIYLEGDGGSWRGNFGEWIADMRQGDDTPINSEDWTDVKLGYPSGCNFNPQGMKMYFRNGDCNGTIYIDSIKIGDGIFEDFKVDNRADGAVEDEDIEGIYPLLRNVRKHTNGENYKTGHNWSMSTADANVVNDVLSGNVQALQIKYQNTESHQTYAKLKIDGDSTISGQKIMAMEIKGNNGTPSGEVILSKGSKSYAISLGDFYSKADYNDREEKDPTEINEDYQMVYAAVDENLEFDTVEFKFDGETDSDEAGRVFVKNIYFSTQDEIEQATIPDLTAATNIDFIKEQLKELDSNADYEIRVGEEKYSVTTDDSGAFDLVTDDYDFIGKEVGIVKVGGIFTQESEESKLDIPARPAAPEKGTDYDVEFSENGDAIVTITGDKDYAILENGNWNPVKESVVVKPDDKITLRKQATDTTFKSNPSDYVNGMYQEEQPAANINYANKALANLKPNAEYIVKDADGNDVIAGTTDDNGNLALDKLEEYYGKTIQVIKKGTPFVSYDSVAQDVTVLTPGSAPSESDFPKEPVDNGENWIIKNVTEDQEYSTDGGKNWTSGPAEVKVPAGTEVLIRDKATDEKPASDSVTIKIPEAPKKDPNEGNTNPGNDNKDNDNKDNLTPEATPAASVDYSTGKLINLVPNADYVITVDGKQVPVKADAEGKVPATDYYGKTIAIVKKGNGTTTTDSAAQILVIAAKTETPKDDNFAVEGPTSDGNIIIKNVTPDYEYSTDNGVVWTPGTGNDIIVPAGTIVLIRKRATATAPASDPIKVVAYPTAASVEQTILTTNTDKKDPAGSTFGTLRLQATGKNKSVKLKWKKVKDADGYIVYGSRCGSKMKKIKTVKGASKTTYTQKKLKKGKYYKYIVAAYKTIEGKDYIIATSKSAHATTTGGKNGNPKKVSVKKAKVTIKKGKKSTIKASYTVTKKVKIHIAKFRYESTNTNVATVSKKGVIKGKSKGKATIYVYAQNGFYKTVKVTVK